MSESPLELPKSNIITMASERRLEARHQLMGVDGVNNKPNVDVSDEKTARKAVENLVTTGLAYARTLEEAAKNSIRARGVPPTIQGVNKDVTRYERALAVIMGERNNPESLLEVIHRESDMAANMAEGSHINRLMQLPDYAVGRGKAKKNDDDVAKEQGRYIAEREQIKTVLAFVEENAPKWAAESKKP